MTVTEFFETLVGPNVRDNNALYAHQIQLLRRSPPRGTMYLHPTKESVMKTVEYVEFKIRNPALKPGHQVRIAAEAAFGCTFGGIAQEDPCGVTIVQVRPEQFCMYIGLLRHDACSDNGRARAVADVFKYGEPLFRTITVPGRPPAARRRVVDCRNF